MATRLRPAADIAVGSRVTVAGKKGVVKFIGPTSFAAGEWIGIELDSKEGKNNGSVNDVKYFDAKEGHGLFTTKLQVRPDKSSAGLTTGPDGKHGGTSASSRLAAMREKNKVRLDRSVTASTKVSPAQDAKLSSASVSSPISGGTAKASSRLAAIRQKNKALKESLAAGKTSPQAPRRAFGSFPSDPRSPSAVSAQGDNSTPGSPASIVSVGSVGIERRRKSAFSATPEGSKTFGSRIDAVAEGRARKVPADVTPAALIGSIESTPDRLTGIPSLRARRGSTGVADLDEPLQGQAASNSRTMPPPPSKAIGQQGASYSVEKTRAGAASVISSEAEAEEANARFSEAEAKLHASEACRRDLEGRLSLLEKKSENALGEERLKASALAKEKAATAAAGRREADMEAQVAELNDACEALTLDKEQLALEKEDLQEKVDELQVELDSTKLDMEHAQLSAKENEAAARALSAAGGSGSTGGVDVKMLAEQNLQLKEALKRLHNHSISEKTELTKSVRALEKEVSSSVSLKDEVEKLRSWKQAKMVEIEDLSEKLDESKAYEEMVEALTTKNLEIGERCGELEAAVVDLESSVELSEELEMQQAEDIRELQAELSRRDVSLHNQKLALEAVMKELEDTKQTIDRFREYAEQLKASRDELASAAATAAAGSGGLSNLEKQALLTQKASIERMTTESRRTKVSERLLQVGLLDAQARGSRLAMLLPGSLLLAETELRCADADLSLCRLVGKASLALELLEVPAMEFVDALAASSPALLDDEIGQLQVAALPTFDHAAALEDCSRLGHEATQSLPIAQAMGEALTVLNVTVLATDGTFPVDAASTVSGEVVSAVIEAEGLVDGLLRVIQDEGGLPPAGSTSTLSALAATAKSIGTRRIAAMASGVNPVSSGNRRDGDNELITSVGEGDGDVHFSVAVTVLQDCLVWARIASLAATGAALRDANSAGVPGPLGSKARDGQPALWRSVRGLWGDLMALRSVANIGDGSWSVELEQLAFAAKDLLVKISDHAADSRTSTPAALELTNQVASLRLSAKELARSPLVGADIRAGGSMPSTPAWLCPITIWRAVAPSLALQDQTRGPSGSRVGAGDTEPPCIARAARVRESLEEAINLKPELEASAARAADLALELGSRSKELSAATSKREQLEALLERAEGSQVTSTDLQHKVLLLQEKSSKVEQENKFMAEALDDLQDSTSRLEAENRTLKMNASPGRSVQSGTGTSGKAVRPRTTPGTAITLGGDKLPVADVLVEGASGSAVAAQEMETSLKTALKWSREEVARWRGEAFVSALSGLRPLPHISSAQGGRPQFSQDTRGTKGRVPGVSSHASDSLRELLNLSKKLEAVRGPPRVVEVQGAAQLSASTCAVEPSVVTAANAIGGATRTNKDKITACLSLASSSWNAQQVLNTRLEKEWREGQGRAEKALSSLVGGSGSRGSSSFGEGMAADLPKTQSSVEESSRHLRVARLHLPSHTYFTSFKARQAVPVTLGRTTLGRLQEALAV